MSSLFKVKAPGMAAAVKHWEKVERQRGTENDVLDAAEDAANMFLLRLRQNADKAGKDWSAAADKAHVQRVAHNVVIVLPHEAHDLEYGTEKNPPRRVMEKTVHDMGSRLKRYMDSQIKLRIFGTGDHL